MCPSACTSIGAVPFSFARPRKDPPSLQVPTASVSTRPLVLTKAVLVEGENLGSSESRNPMGMDAPGAVSLQRFLPIRVTTVTGGVSLRCVTRADIPSN